MHATTSLIVHNKIIHSDYLDCLIELPRKFSFIF